MSISSLLAVMPFLGHKDASDAMKDPTRIGGQKTRRKSRRHTSIDIRPTRDLLGVSSMEVSSGRHRQRSDDASRQSQTRRDCEEEPGLRRSKTTGSAKPKGGRKARRQSHATIPSLSGTPPLARTVTLGTGTHLITKAPSAA